MKRRHARRGLTLIEIMVGVFVLSLTIMTATAMFPLSAVLRDRSGSYTRAAAIAQRKMEQIRRLPTKQINSASLRSLGLVDESAYTNGAWHILPFTTTDDVAGEMVNGQGEIRAYTADPDITQIWVSVSWQNFDRVDQRRTIEATSYVANKEVWQEP